mmetsp:Transcript_41050/g.47229  ORF Transcript_41050/g.47229 Transcript_41050/m.47229 type:complete len:222 (-) Transcript_41050:135-800(-)
MRRRVFLGSVDLLRQPSRPVGCDRLVLPNIPDFVELLLVLLQNLSSGSDLQPAPSDGLEVAVDELPLRERANVPSLRVVLAERVDVIRTASDNRGVQVSLLVVDGIRIPSASNPFDKLDVLLRQLHVLVVELIVELSPPVRIVLPSEELVELVSHELFGFVDSFSFNVVADEVLSFGVVVVPVVGDVPGSDEDFLVFTVCRLARDVDVFSLGLFCWSFPLS